VHKPPDITSSWPSVYHNLFTASSVVSKSARFSPFNQALTGVYPSHLPLVNVQANHIKAQLSEPGRYRQTYITQSYDDQASGLVLHPTLK
jgi:hypothetical protein